MLLAIDTATEILSIALHDGATLVAECTITARRQHSALLAPLIQEMLAGATVASADLTGLAVSVGPGSYTGVRIGVALAKGMAAVSSLPLVPVTTLETIAAAQEGRRSDLPLIATVPAGRKRAIWAEYRRQGGNWRESRAAQISSWRDLLASCSRPCLISGEVTDAGLAAIGAASIGGSGIELAPPAERLRRAGFVAQIAWNRLRESENDVAFPADEVRPIYLKTPG